MCSPDLVVLLGPTAVGKTEIAIRLAERLDGEIVSADSRLFYLGMDIGTAKPSLAERRGVPHHLIDVARPDQPWSLAQFQQQAARVIGEIAGRGRLPLLVGGAGQYVRAVIDGWQPPEVAPDPRLRAALEGWARQVGQDGLHARLAVLDPQAAAGIDPRNLRRTVRALEVILSTGKRFSEQRRRAASPFRLLLLGLMRPRSDLYARIDARVEAMLAAGLVDEVRGLLAQGYPPDLPTFSAIGYREIIQYLQGKCSLEQAVQQIKHDTRVYVRRQANWFKQNDEQIRWFAATPETAAQMEQQILEWQAQ
jgi:tRNA dimethylallyltransferase